MQGNFLQEKILLSRIKSYKDTEAFGELYNIYVVKIYRFVYFKVSTTEEAQDITSETFLKTWEYLNKEEQIENFKALLYKIARNLVIDFYRKRSQAGILTVETEDELENLSSEIIEDVSIRQTEVKLEIQEIEKNLRKLKDEYREVIILKFIEGFSTGEIAKILEKPKSNVRVLTHRALKTLREVIQSSNE